MRKIKTTLYCDRCKKEIKTYEYSAAIAIFTEAENYHEGAPKDLCEDCAKSFKKWMDQGKQDREKVS